MSSLLPRSTNKNNPSPECRGSKTQYETIAVSPFTPTSARGICDSQFQPLKVQRTRLFQLFSSERETAHSLATILLPTVAFDLLEGSKIAQRNLEVWLSKKVRSPGWGLAYERSRNARHLA